MAEIVFGAGLSHGPLLSTPPEQWDLRAQADRSNAHFYRGRKYDFPALVAARAPGFAAQAELPVRRERHARSQAALAAIRTKFRQMRPDVLVIVGNDQRELFSEELTPALMVYRGGEIRNIPYQADHLGPGLQLAESGNCPPGGATYPGAPELADHIVRSLTGAGFDPAQASSLRREGVQRHGIPHAYGFVYHRIFDDAPPPSAPIVLNVHYPHNRPTLGRCLALGRALHQAVRSWDGAARVAFIASGGLSHFVVDEDLDRGVLDAMAAGDEAALAALPEDHFQGGTAEIKNWLPVAAAMQAAGRAFHLVDYAPCYRSEAGTGCAMAFVYWE